MSEPEQEETETEIIVIGKRATEEVSDGSARLSIIVRSGGTNGPTGGLIEMLRGMIATQTDYDLDTRFTNSQKQIILTALRGLADHPVYGPAMAALAAKGADINIIADFTGEHTFGDRGRTYGKNADGTVDQGESITIYINMNPGGASITNIGFSESIVHELIHSLGVPAFDAAIDASGSLIDREVRNEIFSGYDVFASADPGSVIAGVLDTADTGGILAGTTSYEVFSGSDFADDIAPGGGGSLVYSGGGNDRITISIDGDVDEIIDSAGLDTIAFQAGTALSSISTCWSADQQNLAVLVNGEIEAIIVDASGSGIVEQISVGGISYAISAFQTTANVAPNSAMINATVYDSFYGGFVASAITSDGNGDTVSYRIGDVAGDYSFEEWTIDSETGHLYADFTRISETGTRYSFVTVIVSDGLDVSEVIVNIAWTNSDKPIGPIEGAFGDDSPQALMQSGYTQISSLEEPIFYG